MLDLTIQFTLNTLFYLIVIIIFLVLGGLTLNNLPMSSEPGFWPRLKQYLTRNVAKTEEDSPYPELELPVVKASPRLLVTQVERAIVSLGWEVTQFDEKDYKIKAVVTSSIFRFKDDIEVWLEPIGTHVAIHITSSSRVGKGDLGANTRHILDLLHRIEQQIALESPSSH